MGYECPECGQKLKSKTDTMFRMNLIQHLMYSKKHFLSREKALEIVEKGVSRGLFNPILI